MKRLIKIIIILLIIPTLNYSQSVAGSITYVASMNKDGFLKNINENKKKEFKKDEQGFLDELLENAKDIKYILSFNTDESLFYAVEEMENEGDKKMNITSIQSESESIFYTNLKKGEINKQYSRFNELLIDLEKIQWDFTQQTKIIGKYKCYKALAMLKVEGRNGIMYRQIVAWYTPEILISFGVQSFSGLPGLTIELSIDSIIFFNVIKIELNPKDEIIIDKPEGRIVSENEFNKMIKEMNESRKKRN